MGYKTTSGSTPVKRVAEHVAIMGITPSRQLKIRKGGEERKKK